jgi:hypothetical protein
VTAPVRHPWIWSLTPFKPHHHHLFRLLGHKFIPASLHDLYITNLQKSQGNTGLITVPGS